MINIAFEFCTMYEPGEEAPQQFEVEQDLVAQLLAVPRFKDQVLYKGKEYFVWDVIFDLSKPIADRIFVRAVRRVPYPPKNTTSRTERMRHA